MQMHICPYTAPKQDREEKKWLKSFIHLQRKRKFHWSRIIDKIGQFIYHLLSIQYNKRRQRRKEGETSSIENIPNIVCYVSHEISLQDQFQQ